MAVRKVSETQTDTGTWAADSAGIAVDLLRSGAITRLDFTVELTPSATLAGANQVDGLWRTIQNLRVEGGSHTYFTLPADDAAMGGTLLHYANVLDGFGLGHSNGRIVAPSRTYQIINFTMHAGSRIKDQHGRDNKFDLSAFIPAAAEGQLRAIWVTSGNDVMDDTVTITSGVLRVTVHHVIGGEAELLEEMALQGVNLPPGVKAMIPAWTSEVFAHTATASDYATERNVPSGGWLKRIWDAEQDATADRSIRAQDEATGFAIKLPDGTHVMKVFAHQLTTKLPTSTQLEADDTALDFGMYAAEGVFVLDLRQHTSLLPFPRGNPYGADYGLNTMGLGVGDVKLGMTITTYAAGDDSLIVYERYLPVGMDRKVA